MKMPVIFVGHGSPMNAIEDNEFTKEWERIGQKLPKPKAILAISAHWYTDGTKTSDIEVPNQIYDMYGFPKALYELKYPVKGSKELADEVMRLVGSDVTIDNKWGIDHGTWSVLCRMFPEADIPVVQLSVDYRAPAKMHYQIGKALKSLREEGILILASGNIVHNLGLVNWNMEGGYPEAQAFDDYIKTNILNRNFEVAINYHETELYTDRAFSSPDHYFPLLYALGAVSDDDEIEVFNDKCLMGTMSMTGYLFE